MEKYATKNLGTIARGIQWQDRDKARRKIEPHSPCVNKAEYARIYVTLQMVRADKTMPIGEFVLASRFLAFGHGAIIVHDDGLTNGDSAVNERNAVKHLFGTAY